MRELLMIAYLFPPLGGGGVQRSVSFARELTRLGWRCTVLSAGEDARYWAHDPSLLARLPPEVERHPVSEGLLGWSAQQLRRAVPASLRRGFDRAVFFPDRQITWLPAALGAARRLMADHRFAAIYSTGSPWTDHLLAMRLSRESGLPWVADYRDPYTGNQTFRAATPLHARLHRALESRLHREAALVIANTEENLRALRRAFPNTAPKSLALPNGYDEEDFEHLEAAPPRADGRRAIGYGGSFYPGYGPERFFALLRQALDDRLAAALALTFIGKTELGAALSALPPALACEELGYLAHGETLARLAAVDATLLLLPPGPDQGPSGWVPQKLYPYLRLGKPILALCPEGEAATLVRSAGGGSTVIDPDAPDAARTLRAWLEKLAQGELAALRPDPEVVRRFDRRALARRLADELERLASSERGRI
jgi:glycosyltransferase involved in cell wall biosynthesis